MPINYSIAPLRIRTPARLALSALPHGYIAHPDLSGSYTVSMLDQGKPAFLRQRGAIKKFYDESLMIDYCKKHAERGLTSDQEVI